MSYIAALRCLEGVVLVADTQETIEDQKQYCEKLVVSDSYPIAVGGAGIDEITDAFSQEVMERLESSQPATDREIQTTIKASLRDVYENDVPISVIPKQYRTAAFIVAVKRGDRVAIFRTQGKRVYPVPNRVIIGYATAPNNALLDRLYRTSLSMHQAVLLATYLVSQSKKLDSAVGGEETRIALVTPNTACFDNPLHIANVETRAHEFLKLTDALFLECADLTTRDVNFLERLKSYEASILALRKEQKRITAEYFLSDPEHITTHNSPYPYLPKGGFLLTLGLRGTAFSEEGPDIERMKTIIEHIRKNPPILLLKCCSCRKEFDYQVDTSKRPAIRGTFACPDCKTTNQTIEKVIRYRKLGDAAWIEVPITP